MTATANRFRTLLLLLVILVCGVVVGCGSTAALGPQSAEPAGVIDTTDRPAEPTGRAYLAVPAAVQP